MSQRDYESVELRLAAGGGDRYQVEVTASPQGEQPSPAVVHIPAGDMAALQLGGDLAEQGEALWEWLFPPPVERLYRAALATVAPSGGVRLRLRIDPPELAVLPWEMAYDPERGCFPALSTRTPVVRYVGLPFRPTPLASPTPVRILFVSSSPHGLPRLDVAGEKARLLDALADLLSGERVVVDVLEGRATVEALQDALRGDYRILHFGGHGRAGTLLLEEEDGLAHPVGAEALAVLLGDSGVSLAVLNACETGAQAGGPFAGVAPSLVRAGLPAVVAMQAPMPDASAKRFSRTLYAALADGLSLDAAVTEGRKAVALYTGMDQPDWAIPVLYLRAPDGVLWALADEKEAEAETPRASPTGDVYENITISGGVVGAVGGRGHRIEQRIPPAAEDESAGRAGESHED
jgi:hypothetical protein